MTTAIAIAIALAAAGACGDHRAGRASSEDTAEMRDPPKIKLRPVATDALCVTKGEVRIGERVTQPTVRAFARDTSGDAAALTFVNLTSVTKRWQRARVARCAGLSPRFPCTNASRKQPSINPGLRSSALHTLTTSRPPGFNTRAASRNASPG